MSRRTLTPGGVGAMPPDCLATASASFLILNPAQPPFGAHTLNGVPFAIEPDAEVSGFAVQPNATLANIRSIARLVVPPLAITRSVWLRRGSLIAIGL